MNDWVDQTWSSNPTQGSLTHYFNEMSGNKLHFIGKEVRRTAPHTRDWYLANYPNYRRGYIQREIIQQLDATWDFAEFDNWDFVSDYISNNTADTYVDMIIFVWRNISQDLNNPGQGLIDFDFTSNFGDLGGVGDNMNEFTVDGGLRKIKWNYGGSNSIPLGSGVTVRNYLTEDPFKNAVHEFSHYLIGDNTFHNGFGFWGMLSAWGTRSYVANSFERYRLGWVADSTSYTISNTTQTLTNKTLSDFVTGKNAYRFIINTSPQEYFFVENHQKTSYWENNAPFWGSQSGTVENGIYVIRKAGIPDYYTDPHSWLQLIPADGRFNWVVNQSTTNPQWGSAQIPVFKQLVPNKDNGYHDNQWIPFSYGGLTSPDAIHYTEQNGIPVQDVRFQGDGKDAFRVGYNQVFSPWSNPNNQRTASETTPFGFEITNFSNGVYTLNIYVNTSQNASPSKPQNIRTSGLNSEPTISWDANTEQDISSYKVYRSVNNGSYQLIADNVTTTSITDNLHSIISTLQNVKYQVQVKDNQNLLSVFSEPCTLTFTQISGGSISSNQNWSGNYIINSNLTVNGGIILAVQPSSQIFITDGSSLTINGTLNAVGTSSSGITFNRSGSSGTWNGIQFNSGSSGNLQYCNINNATVGVYFYNSSSPQIRYCTFEYNGTAISCYYYSSPQIISNSNFRYNTIDGIRCNSYSSPGLLSYGYPGYNVIRNNSRYGVYASYNSNPGLGGSSYGGQNSIYSNSSCEVLAEYNCNIIAQYNWWGSSNPSPYEFCTNSSTITYLPALSSDPNPGRSVVPTPEDKISLIKGISLSKQADDLSSA
ncbi:MAG: hypothetical protein C0412_19455, partial [Flavobacterium sp.]|nr:hypothetical protein [Flavobacterium sp.]